MLSARPKETGLTYPNDQRPTANDRMRIAYLDCFSGISGDMFLGALLDAGVPAQLFEDTVRALNIGARLEMSRVNRSGISATKLDVLVNGEKELPREVFWEQQSHKHDGEHSHTHDHHHSHEHEHHHSRGLKEIKQDRKSTRLNSSH